MYMQVAGYQDFTKRDLRNLTRVMKGYLPADLYAKRVLEKYYNMHGEAGSSGQACLISPNRVHTRDQAILNTVERKIYPARLLWEFQMGPQVGFSSDCLIDLNRRLCGDIYEQAGCFRNNISISDLDAVMAKHADNMRNSGRDVIGTCTKFELLLGDLLNLHAFQECNLFTAMAFTAKIAFFWGYVCRFEQTDLPGMIRFRFSDRVISSFGNVRVTGSNIA